MNEVEDFEVATKLPTGLDAYNEWAASVIAASDVPDNDSTRFALAVMVMHIRADSDKVPKAHFISSLNKAATNEVVYSIIQELKAKQDAAKAAATLKVVPDANISTENAAG